MEAQKFISKPEGLKRYEARAGTSFSSTYADYALKYGTFRLDWEYYNSSFMPFETKSKKTFINSPC